MPSHVKGPFGVAIDGKGFFDGVDFPFSIFLSGWYGVGSPGEGLNGG